MGTGPAADGPEALHDPSILGQEILRVARSSLFRELWAYMSARKKWWLAPIILMLVLVGGLLVFAQGSALAPFIYTIF